MTSKESGRFVVGKPAAGDPDLCSSRRFGRPEIAEIYRIAPETISVTPRRLEVDHDK